MIVINTIYTIGYTAFPINEFLDVIKHYGIHCVIDVRSSPFSNYYSDYNKDELENTEPVTIANILLDTETKLQELIRENKTIIDNKLYESVAKVSLRVISLF